MDSCDPSNIYITGYGPDRDPKRADIPPIPFKDKHLRVIAVNNDVRMWVPVDRPKSVTTTSGGIYEGDIIAFWVETPGAYAKHRFYGPGKGGWYRFTPVDKEGEYVEDFEEIIERDYRPLRGESP